MLGDRYILFAEWLVHHAVPYPEERYEKVYCFDVMEKETGKYLPQDQVKEMVTELGLTYVPVFYDGPFVSWEAIEAMVGRTELGGAYGEGVVVKNMTRLNDPNEKLPFYTKIVGADFAEKKSISRTHMEQMSADAKRQALADSVVTEARVRKMILNWWMKIYCRKTGEKRNRKRFQGADPADLLRLRERRAGNGGADRKAVWKICGYFDHKPGERNDEKPEINLCKKEHKDRLSWRA